MKSLHEHSLNEKNNSLTDFYKAVKKAGAKNLSDMKYDPDLEAEKFHFDTNSGQWVEVYFGKGYDKVRVSSDYGIEELTPKETVELIKESFDWEQYDETDIAGPSIDSLLEELLEELDERIYDTLEDSKDAKRVKKEIKKYIIQLIKDWN